MPVDFELSEQDQEDLRWYQEDYVHYPQDPAPRIATRIETRMAEIGEELFAALFQSSASARNLWNTLQPRLGDTRITIVSTVRDASTIPWELLRDPQTGMTLALAARTLVQTVTKPETSHQGARPTSGDHRLSYLPHNYLIFGVSRYHDR